MGKQRIVALDLLRLAAVLLVLGRHAADAPDSSALCGLFDIWKRGGWVGVDLFFVLSGFLVSGLLFHEYDKYGSISFGRFFLRRGGKIWPAFLAFILITTAIRLAMDRPIEIANVAAELCFVQSYYPGLWPHTWSLSVEEWFYIGLPLLLIAIVKVRRNQPFKAVPWIAGAAAIACLLMRCLSPEQFSMRPHLFSVHLRADALLFGVAIAYLWRYHKEGVLKLTPYRKPLIALGVIAMSPAFYYDIEDCRFIYTAGLTLFYLGAGSILVGALLCNQPTNRLVAAVASLGAISYSVYLWHMPAAQWCFPVISKVTGGQYETAFSAYVLSSFAIGAVAYWAVEKPGVALRDRLTRG